MRDEPAQFLRRIQARNLYKVAVHWLGGQLPMIQQYRKYQIACERLTK